MHKIYTDEALGVLFNDTPGSIRDLAKPLMLLPLAPNERVKGVQSHGHHLLSRSRGAPRRPPRHPTQFGDTAETGYLA